MTELAPYAWLLARGALITVGVAALSLVLAAILGVLVGMPASRPGVTRHVVKVYVELVRSVPLLILVFFVYYGLPLATGWNPSPYASATIALTLYGGAYMVEAVRSGILSVGEEQWEAARALGLRYLPTMALVVAPQAMRVVAPAAIGIFIDLVKGSSVMSIIGFTELMQTSINIRNAIYVLSPLFAAAAIYFVICSCLSLLGSWVERRLQWPGH